MKLKGICEIELKDAVTGETVKRTRDKNIVTSALQNLFSLKSSDYYAANYNLLQSLYPTYTPIVTNSLGGVICFADAFAGDNAQLAATTIPSLSNAVIAHAGNTVYTGVADLTRGSYNATESGVVEGGYKYVWDFSTSQGNGTISSVCLTSADGAAGIWNGDNNNVPDNTLVTLINPVTYLANRYPLPIGYDENKLIFTGSLSNDFRTRIMYAWQPQHAISINDTLIRFPTNDTAMVDSGAVRIVVNSTNPMSRSLSYDGNEIVSFYATSSTGYITRINKSTFEITDELSFSIPDVNLYSGVGDHSGFHAKDGYLYARDYNDTKKIYKINMTDTTDVTLLTCPISASYFLGEFGDYMVIYTNDNRYSSVPAVLFDGSNFRRISSFGPTSSDFSFAPMFNQSSPYFVFPIRDESIRVYYYLCKFNAYLATIDNLTTPVTKTNAQTMKIIYTVTEDVI